jgi:mRNA-degrading endonuclease toxin of MazEF toxin-antitoxin module
VEDKDFERWHFEKEKINQSDVRSLFNEREIWFCAIGANVGSEQDGKGDHFLRPVLVFKKFNDEIFWGIPLTHSPKRDKYYFSLRENPHSTAILSQIRLLDAKRLQWRMGRVDVRTFTALQHTFIRLIRYK